MFWWFLGFSLNWYMPSPLVKILCLLCKIEVVHRHTQTSSGQALTSFMQVRLIGPGPPVLSRFSVTNFIILTLLAAKKSYLCKIYHRTGKAAFAWYKDRRFNSSHDSITHTLTCLLSGFSSVWSVFWSWTAYHPVYPQRIGFCLIHPLPETSCPAIPY